jgi:hypothetical protein
LKKKNPDQLQTAIELPNASKEAELQVIIESFS